MARRLCLAVAVAAAWAVGWSAGQQSSESYCNFTPRHTLCKYSGVHQRCGKQVQVRRVGDDQAKSIVDQHNQLRSRVAAGNERRGSPGPQPRAANMRLMEWDDELAQVAQGHADQCLFQHDCGDCRRVSRFGVGQNLYISFQSNFDTSIKWQRAIKSWYDEVADFSPANIEPFQFAPGVGHYTQMLWWSTYKVGCGFIMYKEGSWWKKLYTCNYGPSGNIIFSAMYRKGSPCSSCPSGTTCSPQHPGLCQSVESNTVGSGQPITTPSTTTPFPDTEDGSEEDNAILTPMEDVGFDAFNGFIDINSISPRDADLDALIRFFNSRGRSSTRTPLPIRVDAVFTRRVVRPPLITARPTTPAATTTTTSTTSTTQPRAPLIANTTTTTSTTTMPTTIPTTDGTTTTTTTTTTAATTTTTTTPPNSTVATSSPQGSSFRSGPTTNQVLALRTITSPRLRGKTIPPAPAGQQQEQEPGTGGGSDLMPFLRRAGATAQIIRTASVDNVKSIIESLPARQRPIVLFRSASGTLTELNPKTLTPLRRTSRSTTTTTRGPGKLPSTALLACDLDASPCDVFHIGGNWTQAESEGVGQYMQATLEEGEGAQVVVQELVAAPSSQAVCVAVSHRRALLPHHPANATIPPLQVGVMPVGEAMILRPVLGAPGVWEMSRITLRDIKEAFMLVLTVGPASATATVDLDAIMVTDGVC